MSSSSEHPFLSWAATLKAEKRAALEGKDFILNERAGKEFAVGLHNAEPLLCYQAAHKAAIESIRWTVAAILYNTNGKDWIVLSSKDIRIKGSTAQSAMPLRLFIPVSFGRMDSWKDFAPANIHLGMMEIKKGSPGFTNEPFKSLPLKLIG